MHDIELDPVAEIQQILVVALFLLCAIRQYLMADVLCHDPLGVAEPGGLSVPKVCIALRHHRASTPTDADTTRYRIDWHFK